MPAYSKYNPDYHNDWAWSLSLKGCTDQEIADAFGISRRTLIRWRNEFPQLAEAMERGKASADSKVEKKLYEKALGMVLKDEERIVDIDPKTGETKPVRVKTITKNVAPDTMAIMYWLNNRMRGTWSKRQEVELSTKDDTEDVLIYLPSNGRDESE